MTHLTPTYSMPRRPGRASLASTGRWLTCWLVAALLSAASVSAQDCAEALPDAEGHYFSGRFDEAINLLDGCLEAGAFSREERKQAYRLIGLGYIGKDLQGEARQAIEMLLQLVPDYHPDPVDDPPPFVQMVEEIQRAAPAQPPALTGTFDEVTLQLGTSPLERDLQSLFRDPSGGDLTFSARLDAPSVVSADLEGSLLTLRPLTAGRAQLTLTALNVSGLSVAHTVDIHVAGEIAQRSSGRKLGRWLLIGGGLVAGGIAAAVLAGGGGGGGTGGTGPIGGPPPLPGLF